MPLAAYCYGDPANVAERRQEAQQRQQAKQEARSCAGCVSLGEFLGQPYCRRGLSAGQTVQLVRCTSYTREGETP